MMTYVNEGGYIYRVDGAITSLVGPVDFAETIRLDSDTVADVTYTFDLDLGEYVETGRIEREEPEPTPEPSETEILQERLTLVESMLIEIIYGGV